MPVSGDGVPEPRGLQLWVDLPKEYKMVDPSYQELDPDQYVLRRLSSCIQTHFRAEFVKRSLKGRTDLSRFGSSAGRAMASSLLFGHLEAAGTSTSSSRNPQPYSRRFVSRVSASLFRRILTVVLQLLDGRHSFTVSFKSRILAVRVILIYLLSLEG